MQKLSRRSFLKQTVVLGTGAVLTITGNRYKIAFGREDQVTYKLRILHTNDTHARIEPETLTIGRDTAGVNITRKFGGMARRKTLIDQLKASKPVDEEMLVVDAGDVFQGTLFFNQFSGAADLEFMNSIGYEAMAIGNHEFDKGQAALRDFVTGATFPVLSANVDIDMAAVLAAVKSATPLTGAGKIGPRTLITKGTKKIGIFGLTPPDTGILTNAGAGITFGTDLKTIAQAQITALKADGADIIVGLTHIGFGPDEALVKQLSGLNCVIGGHSHTAMLPQPAPKAVGSSTTTPYPTVVKDLDNKDVIVCTDWEWGKWLGDVTLNFDGSGALVSANGVIRPVWADGILGTPARALIEGEGAEITPDATIQARITTFYKPPIAVLEATKVGTATSALVGETAQVRTRETNLGNLIAEIILARTKQDGAQVALMNGGGIRASIAAGDVKVSDVLKVLPFGNTLGVVTVTGAQLIEALENGVSQLNLSPASSSLGRFCQIAGMRFTYSPQRQARFADNSTPRDPSKDKPGKRVILAEIKTSVPAPGAGIAADTWTAINPTASYRVATNSFLITGGDGYSMFAAGTNKVDAGFILADVVNEYFTNNSPVDVATDGRITAKWDVLLPLAAKPGTA